MEFQIILFCFDFRQRQRLPFTSKERKKYFNHRIDAQRVYSPRLHQSTTHNLSTYFAMHDLTHWICSCILTVYVQPVTHTHTKYQRLQSTLKNIFQFFIFILYSCCFFVWAYHTWSTQHILVALLNAWMRYVWMSLLSTKSLFSILFFFRRYSKSRSYPLSYPEILFVGF